MKGVVLDASAALEVILPGTVATFEAAGTLFSDLAAERLKAHVPVLLFNEVAAVTARAVRSKRITRPQVEVLAAGDWHERAMRWGCQVADGAYLGLALGLGTPIATTDRGLMTAARSNKAKLHWADGTA